MSKTTSTSKEHGFLLILDGNFYLVESRIKNICDATGNQLGIRSSFWDGEHSWSFAIFFAKCHSFGNNKFDAIRMKWESDEFFYWSQDFEIWEGKEIHVVLDKEGKFNKNDMLNELIKRYKNKQEGLKLINKGKPD